MSDQARDMMAKIEAAIRQNSGLIAEQILAGEKEEGDEVEADEE
jgi:recombination protein RecA